MPVNNRIKNHPKKHTVVEVWRRRRRQRPSPDLYQLTAHFTPDLIYEWYPSQDYALYIGDIDARLGYDPGEFPRTWTAFQGVIHPEDRPRFQAALEEGLESHKPIDIVYRVYCKNGSVCYWRDRGQGICDSQGNLTRFVGILQEVTQQLRAEEALKELNATLERRVAERSLALGSTLVELQREIEQRQKAEARFRMIAELTSDLGYIVKLRPDLGFELEWISEGMPEILGYPVEEISDSEKWIAKIHPEDRWITIDNVRRTAQGEAGSGIVRFRKPDGSYIWLEIYNRPVWDASGTRIEKIIGAGREITQRKKAEEELARSQARYRTLFDDSPVSLWEEDFSSIKAGLDALRQKGVEDFRAYFTAHPNEGLSLADLIKVIDINRAALGLYKKLSKQDLITNIGALVRDYPERWLEEIIAIAEGQTDFTLEGTSSKEDEVLYYTALHFAVVRGYEHNYGRVIISIEDLTGRRRAEMELQNKARRLELTSSITLASLSLGNFKETLHSLAERIGDFGGADACFITRWDAERQIPIFLAGSGDVDYWPASQFLASGEASITRAALEAGRILIARPDDPQWFQQHFAVLSSNRTAIALPLKMSSEKIGAVVLVYNQPPTISADDLELWNQVAAQVSLAIASLQLYEHAQRRADELEKLTRVSSELRKAQASSEILEITVREMVQIVGADRGALLIRRSGKWLLEAEKGDPEFGGLGEFQLEEELVQRIMAKSQEYIFADPVTGVYFPNCPWQKGLDALSVIPLNSSEAVIGLVAIGWLKPKDLTPEDRRLLTAVAEISGNALQRAGLLETLEQRVGDRTRDLQTLFNLSALSNGQQGLKKVMQSALRQLIPILGGSAGIFYLVNPTEGTLEVEMTLGLPRRVISQINHVPVELDRWRRNGSQKSPVVLSDLRSMPVQVNALLDLGFNGAIYMQIQASGQPWGIMCILGDNAKLNPEEKSLMLAVADLVATAAENAQLQLRSKEAAILEERQRLARALHDSVTQSLYSLTLFSEAGREHSLSGNQERTLHYLERSSETAHRALREMRMLLYELRPPELDRLGLAGALSFRLEAVEQRVGLEARFTNKYTTRFPADVEEALFWIAQEALNNVFKHANASKVALNLESEAQWVRLEIKDNGQGFKPGEQSAGGMGLVSMGERAAKIGAALRVESQPGRGTRVKVELNLASSEKENNEHG